MWRIWTPTFVDAEAPMTQMIAIIIITELGAYFGPFPCSYS